MLCAATNRGGRADAGRAMKPNWICNGEREQELLAKWTLGQLSIEPSGMEWWQNQQRKRAKFNREPLPTNPRLANMIKYLGWREQRSDNGKFERMILREGKRLKKRKPIMAAVKASDGDALIRLSDDDSELLRLAIEALTHKPGRGRKEGEPRETDHDLEKLDSLRCACVDIKRIYEIWQREFSKRNRSYRNPPTALGIAARRWDLDESELEQFRKTFAA